MKFTIILSVLITGLFLSLSPSSFAQQSPTKPQEAPAVTEYRKRLERTATVMGLNEEGRTLAGQKKYREAIKSYTEAINLDPNNIEAYAGRGDARLALKDYELAISDYDHFIRPCSARKAERERDEGGGTTLLDIDCLDRSLPSAYNNRGVAKDRLADKLGACKDFREACKSGLDIACKNSEDTCNDKGSSDTKNDLPSSSQSKELSYAGQYKGEWTATPAPFSSFKGGEKEHNGTWDISIDSDGEITGTEFDETSGQQGTLKGFIDGKGFARVFVKYEITTKMEGKLEKNGIRLVGTLKVYCGEIHCLNMEIILKRK